MEIILSIGESETHGTAEQQGVDIEVVDPKNICVLERGLNPVVEHFL